MTQRMYFGTKMAARMTSSGSNTCKSFSIGLLDCMLVCLAMTALMDALLVFAASPSCAHHIEQSQYSTELPLLTVSNITRKSLQMGHYMVIRYNRDGKHIFIGKKRCLLRQS